MESHGHSPEIELAPRITTKNPSAEKIRKRGVIVFLEDAGHGAQIPEI
jgi:hypothetical protein